MPAGKPNVLLIVADDLGWFDLSCYHQGNMGSRTPNVDRIADPELLWDREAILTGSRSYPEWWRPAPSPKVGFSTPRDEVSPW